MEKEQIEIFRRYDSDFTVRACFGVFGTTLIQGFLFVRSIVTISTTGCHTKSCLILRSCGGLASAHQRKQKGSCLSLLPMVAMYSRSVLYSRPHKQLLSHFKRLDPFSSWPCITVSISACRR